MVCVAWGFSPASLKEARLDRSQAEELWSPEYQPEHQVC